MKLWSDTLKPGEAIPPRFAFGRPDPKDHVALAGNRNPHLAWSDLPEGTRSLALIVHDTDVPTRPDDVNQAGRTVPLSLPRTNFYHWILVDLPPSHGEIAEAAYSEGVTPKGKGGPAAPGGLRQGANDFTGWFAGSEDMGGTYHGYDGPCPPWNDEALHHYHFTLYALDVERLDVEGSFTGQDALKAMEGHVLDSASFTTTYAIYDQPRVRPGAH